MAKRPLYLCEKPIQATTVAEALGNPLRRNGYIEAGNAIVTWAFGHLLQPKNPEDYNPDWKAWSIANLPIIPKPFQFKANPSTVSQLKIIKNLLKDASEVIISTDPDREGEMIAHQILEDSHWRGPVHRLWMHDLTPQAIQLDLKKLLPGDSKKSSYYAALARCQGDWLVGMNITRAATLRFRQGGSKPLSIGRVQTPTLALIVRLERKILNFKPEDYYEIVADVESENHKLLMRYAPSERIMDRAKAEQIARAVSGAKGALEVDIKDKEQEPPPLFDLNKLQQAANRRFGWSADKTLNVAQALYEKHKVLTYPRSDCSALPEAHKQIVQEKMSHLFEQTDLAYLKNSLSEPLCRKSIYDDKKVSAHFAIVPTAQKADLASMSNDERMLYLLVARSYLAAHMPNYHYRVTTVRLTANSIPFSVSGNVPIFEGWKTAFNGSPKEVLDEKEEDNKETVLPPVRNGAPAQILKADIDKKTTQPPKRFTDDTLLGAMKNIAPYVESEEAKKRLRQTSGIGTSATRANIIKTLKDRDYIQVQKRYFYPTQIGMDLITAIEGSAPAYCDPALTAAWEDVLEDIEQGRKNMSFFVERTIERVERDVHIIAKASGTVSSGNSNSKSPKASTGSVGNTKNPPQGTPLKVEFKDKDKAKSLGARWDSNNKRWVAPANLDLSIFRAAGFL